MKEAIAHRTPLRVQGGGSKTFLGRPVEGALLDTRIHHGVVHHDPSELVVTARAGTPLHELEATLEAAGQRLACEPPHLGPGATVGGMVATGLSGPRRPWVGAVRDFVLGARLVTGLGTHLRFGGEVMKSVAGYDVSRLLTGSYGCLGVITEVSLKVLPRPRAAAGLRLELDAATALARLTEWSQKVSSISAACHDGVALHLRLEGGEEAVRVARKAMGGDDLPLPWFQDLTELRLPFFADPRPLWRLSVPRGTGILAAPGPQLIDWGGAQRWLKSDAPASVVREIATAVGGHASCFTAGVTDLPFHPLSPELLRLHRQLKERLDPMGVFNRGRMYPEF